MQWDQIWQYLTSNTISARILGEIIYVLNHITSVCDIHHLSKYNHLSSFSVLKTHLWRHILRFNLENCIFRSNSSQCLQTEILHKNICISVYVIQKDMFSLKYTALVLGAMVNVGAVFENRVLRRVPEFKKEKQTQNWKSEIWRRVGWIFTIVS